MTRLGEILRSLADKADGHDGRLDALEALPSNKLLWSGAWYMTASQTSTLSEAVSAQQNGIVLAFSAYSSGAAQNYNWQHFFVPKKHVADHSGVGTNFVLGTTRFKSIGNKYLYIKDTSITGYADNLYEESGSAGVIDGISNNYWVLRYVYGV